MERIQLRRDSALGWSTNNPILASGEIGIELSPTPAEIVLFKVGDGITSWNSLPYQNEAFSGATLGANTFSGKQIAPIISAKNMLVGDVQLGSVSGATTLNFTNGQFFTLTTSGAVTLSVSNIPTLANESLVFVVSVTQGATPYAITWFGGITWVTTGSVAPSAPGANKTTEYIFTTTNGTSFLGRVGASN